VRGDSRDTEARPAARDLAPYQQPGNGLDDIVRLRRSVMRMERRLVAKPGHEEVARGVPSEQTIQIGACGIKVVRVTGQLVRDKQRHRLVRGNGIAPPDEIG